MEKISKTIFVVLILTLARVLNAADCDTSNVIFGINAKETKYLRYSYFHNQFDSADVSYLFGEIRIIDSSGIKRISFAPRQNEYLPVQGDSVQGIDNILMNLAKTENFSYLPGAKIKFFRRLSANIPCDDNLPIDHNNNQWDGEITKWEDYLWLVGKNKISDLSEFLVEIVEVDNSNNEVVIDSVGVAPNPSQVLAQRYGTKPDSMNHFRDLPNDFANKNVFLRIKPKRTGTTPYGMVMKIIPFWISQSSLMEYDSIKSKKDCSAQMFQLLVNRYFNDLMIYCDSVKLNTGYLPINLPDIDVLSEVQKQTFYDIFFDEIVVNGDTILKEKPPYEQGYANLEIKHSISDNNLRLVKIYPLPIQDYFNVVINSKRDYQNTIMKVYNYNGEFVSNIWEGDISSGESIIKVTNVNLPNGLYYLRFDLNSNPLAIFVVIAK